MKGAFHDIPALSEWNAEYLDVKIGSANITVLESPESNGDYDNAVEKKMTVSEYLTTLSRPNSEKNTRRVQDCRPW